MDDSAELVEVLRAAGCVFAEDEAAVLLACPDRPLTEMVSERLAGRPLEHVVGRAGFCGIVVLLDDGVFVPRQRTALLVRLAASLGGVLAVDLCCGSGALGAALLAVRPSLEVHAADIDHRAVACARRNLPVVHEGDLFDALPAGLRGRVDLLLANVPYVPSAAVGLLPPEAREHEPLVALDGGEDGLDVLRRVAADAGGWLAPGGSLLVEVGDAQVAAALAILRDRGLLAAVETDEDLGATAVVGTRPA